MGLNASGNLYICTENYAGSSFSEVNKIIVFLLKVCFFLTLEKI
jgi:hypothetical protein